MTVLLAANHLRFHKCLQSFICFYCYFV